MYASGRAVCSAAALAALIPCSTACHTTFYGPDAAPADAEVEPINTEVPDAAPLAIDATAPDAAAETPCTEGDSRATDPNTGRCYLLFLTPATWADARSACQGLGGDLVAVGSEEEQLIVGLLSSNFAPGLPDSWMGGRDGPDVATEGTWRWSDDTEFWSGGPKPTGTASGYENWRVDEPNNVNDEDCLIIEGDRADLGYSWDDRRCDNVYSYLCER